MSGASITVVSSASAPPSEWPVMNTGGGSPSSSRARSCASADATMSFTVRFDASRFTLSAFRNPRCTFLSPSTAGLQSTSVSQSDTFFSVPRNATTTYGGSSSTARRHTKPCVSATSITSSSSNPASARILRLRVQPDHPCRAELPPQDPGPKPAPRPDVDNSSAWPVDHPPDQPHRLGARERPPQVVRCPALYAGRQDQASVSRPEPAETPIRQSPRAPQCGLDLVQARDASLPLVPFGQTFKRFCRPAIQLIHPPPAGPARSAAPHLPGPPSSHPQVPDYIGVPEVLAISGLSGSPAS